MSIDTFRYFYSALAQSMAALFAVGSVFVIFQLQYLIDQHHKTCNAFKEYMRRRFNRGGHSDKANEVDEWLNKDVFYNLLKYFEIFKEQQPGNLQPALADYYLEFVNQENFKRRIKFKLWIPTGVIALTLMFSLFALHNADALLKDKVVFPSFCWAAISLTILSLGSLIRYVAYAIRGYKKEYINNLLSHESNDAREKRIARVEEIISERIAIERIKMEDEMFKKIMSTLERHPVYLSMITAGITGIISGFISGVVVGLVLNQILK